MPSSHQNRCPCSWSGKSTLSSRTLWFPTASSSGSITRFMSCSTTRFMSQDCAMRPLWQNKNTYIQKDGFIEKKCILIHIHAALVQKRFNINIWTYSKLVCWSLKKICQISVQSHFLIKYRIIHCITYFYRQTSLQVPFVYFQRKKKNKSPLKSKKFLSVYIPEIKAIQLRKNLCAKSL